MDPKTSSTQIWRTDVSHTWARNTTMNAVRADDEGHALFVLSPAISREELHVHASIVEGDIQIAVDGMEPDEHLAIIETDGPAETDRKQTQIEDFVRGVIHDLQTPLSVARGRLELAAEDSESDHLRTAETALARIAELIDELRLFVHEDDPIDRRQSVDLAEIVNAAWTTAGSERASLHTTELGRVNADERRLHRLFENLFRNAIKHNEPPVTLHVGSLENTDGFYVADDGHGIPDSDRDAIFDTGYTTSEESTGLGLTIVNQIVGAHGWSLTLTESTDGGTRFEICTNPSQP